MGRERGRVLAVAATDPVMSVVAPVALAASAGTALVVDMGETLGRAGARTLEDIAADGPTRAEAVPGRKGVAVIRSGRLRTEDAVELVGRLALAWPAVVIRTGPGVWRGPVVPVEPLFPGLLCPRGSHPAVWQRVRGGPSSAPGPGPVLPPAGAANIRRILAGGMPLPGRWLRSWRRIWGLPWA